MSFELTLIQIFLLGTNGGIFNHKKKFKEGLDPPGNPESPREGINNIWPVGIEDLHSVIFSP